MRRSMPEQWVVGNLRREIVDEIEAHSRNRQPIRNREGEDFFQAREMEI